MSNEETLNAYAKRMQELEQLVGEINMVVLSPRSEKAQLSIIKGLLRADILKGQP